MSLPFSLMQSSAAAKFNLGSSLFNKNSRPVDLPGGPNTALGALGPGGFWDRRAGDKRGPLGPLEQDNKKKSQLDKNILVNQVFVLCKLCARDRRQVFAFFFAMCSASVIF